MDRFGLAAYFIVLACVALAPHQAAAMPAPVFGGSGPAGSCGLLDIGDTCATGKHKLEWEKYPSPSGVKPDDYTFGVKRSASLLFTGSWKYLVDWKTEKDPGLFVKLFENGASVASGVIGDGTMTLAYAGLIPKAHYLVRIGADFYHGKVKYFGELLVTPLPPALLLFGSGLTVLSLYRRSRRRARGP